MLDVQLQSIKGYNAANWGPDIAAHVVTQRYAQLTTSLLLLNADYQARPATCNSMPPAAGLVCAIAIGAMSSFCWLTAHPPCQDDQLDQYIDRLRFAAMDLLMRLSRRFPRKRQGTIFLVTNLTHVVQVSCKAPWHMLSRRSSHGSSLVTMSLLLVCGAQRLRDAASQGRHAAHAPGMSPAPPSAPLGAAGAETLQEFQACGPNIPCKLPGPHFPVGLQAPRADLRYAVCQHFCTARRTSSRRALALMWRKPSCSALAR